MARRRSEIAILLLILLLWARPQAWARDKDRQFLLKAEVRATHIYLSWHNVAGQSFRLFRFDKANESDPDPEQGVECELAPGFKDFYDIGRITAGAIIKYRLEAYSKEGKLTSAHQVLVKVPDQRQERIRPGLDQGHEGAA